MKGKLNGISLFSGYGGIDLALEEWVRPILYCDIEPYAQAILLSRMDDGALPFAPIWNDVTTLDGRKFRGLVDIIFGGFPCQDISCAGKGLGLDGKRSGLYFQVERIAREASPTFLFLENVANIRTKGSIEVSESLASIGYDARFGHISASEVGANHQRDRWFCLAIKREVAHSVREGFWRKAFAAKKENTKGCGKNNGRTEGSIIDSSQPERASTDPDSNELRL